MGPGLSACTVLYNTLNMHLVANIIGCQFRALIGCLTFGGAHVAPMLTIPFYSTRQGQHSVLTGQWVVLMALSKAQLIHVTARERLIRSHSSARFCFELSGNSN